MRPPNPLTLARVGCRRVEIRKRLSPHSLHMQLQIHCCEQGKALQISAKDF